MRLTKFILGNKWRLAFACTLFLSSFMLAEEPLSQAGLDAFAKTLQLRYAVLDNRPTPACKKEQAGGSCFQAEIQLSVAEAFDDKHWKIYFSHVAPVQASMSKEFRIEHVNGDLHRISPTPEFTGFKPGEIKTIPFLAAFWHFAESDVMPNYYVVVDGLEPRVIVSTRAVVDAETGLEKLTFVAPFTDPEKQLKSKAGDATRPATAAVLFDENVAPLAPSDVLNTAIIPTPLSLRRAPDGGSLSLGAGIRVISEGFERKAIRAALERLAQLGVSESNLGAIVSIKKSPLDELASEAYVLDVDGQGIEIRAADEAGAYYALQSLAGLLTPGSTSVPALHIADAPRYPFRGLHVDVARNFHSKTLLLKVLDTMGAYKLNRLHLHLADDEGWRLQIPELPELTAIGARRCHDLSETRCLLPQLGSGPSDDAPVNGFYTVEDYQEILRAAQERHIEVIPSLDMPGHARAAVRAMHARYRRFKADGKQAAAEAYLLQDLSDTTAYESVQFYHDNTINPCVESSYAFFDQVITSVARAHAEAGVPLRRFHIGGDETVGAWGKSPACEHLIKTKPRDVKSEHELVPYFLERVAALLQKRGVEIAGWNDGIGKTHTEKMPKTVQANAWGTLFGNGHVEAHRLANLGWQVVVSSPDVTYFDFPYAADPLERGYYWGSRSTPTRKVFDFMPDNLPAQAEIWTDREGLPMRLDDTVKRDTSGAVLQEPLRAGVGFYGLQAHLWSETVRSDEQVEYMLFPRLIALAERAWHKADWEVPYRYQGAIYSPSSGFFTDAARRAREQDWARFSMALAQKELAKLDRAGVAYRVPTVGARIVAGKLEARGELPGLAVEFREGHGPWKPYVKPVAVEAAVEVRARSADGRRAGRSLLVAMPH